MSFQNAEKIAASIKRDLPAEETVEQTETKVETPEVEAEINEPEVDQVIGTQEDEAPQAEIPQPTVPDWLEDESPAVTGKAPEEIDDDYKKKAKEYEEVSTDPLVSAILSWRKNGGSDIREFVKSVGVSEQNKSIEQYFTEEAVSLGFEGEELEEAVRQKMDDYESKGKLDQRKILQEYKKVDQEIAERRLREFSGKQAERQQYVQGVQQKATESLQKRVKDMVGQKYKSLPIDESMAKVILEQAPFYSTEMTDESGNLSGYNIDAGIEMAIWKNFSNKLLRSVYMQGHTEGISKYVSERNRPSPNSASTSQSLPEQKNKTEDALKEYRKKMGY
jgi:hypothetical protein